MNCLVKYTTQVFGASILVLAAMTFTQAVAQSDVTSFNDQNGTKTTFTQQADEFILNVQDLRGVSTHYRYNKSGQILSETSPEQGVLSYTYDDQGRPFQIEMEADISSKLTFDEQNRVTRQVWREGSDERIATRYLYDDCENGEGKLCRVVHNDHVMRYKYTLDGKLALVKTKLADEEVVETIHYVYDDNGLLKSMRYPSGLRVAYRYDEQGRVLALNGVYETGTDSERFTILRAIRYDEVTGLVIGFMHGNGISTRFRYNAQGRLTKLTRRLNGEIVDKDLYAYDSQGLIASIDRLNSTESRRYEYDPEGRLIQESQGDSTVSNMTMINYSYDAVGNRLMRTVDGRTKTYNYAPDANQLQSIERKSLSYDTRGNLLEDRAGSRSFDYSATNRMEAFYRDGELKAEYDYDVNGRRIRKRLHRPNSEGVKSVRFLYNTNGRLISQTSRREDRRTVRARDLVWLGPIPVAQIERVVTKRGLTKKANVLSLHTDYLGTPRQAKDEYGKTVWSWHGDAFGARAGNIPAVNRDPDGDGKKTEVSLRFPGQYHDRESGLWYNHNRDYDPKLGRHIQSDPIGLLGGINRYTYVSNKPTYLVDPNGLAEICYYEGTGYTPNRSDDSRNPSGDPSGPEPIDEVVSTGERQSNDPRRKCIQIPDPMPIIPTIPHAPPTPPVPVGPVTPNPPPGPDKKKDKKDCTPEDDAVADAVRNAFRNPNSSRNENGGLILRMPDNSIATIAAPPGATYVPGTSPTVDIFNVTVPAGATVLGGYHTHPSSSVLHSDGQYYSPAQFFSPNDFMLASPGSAWLSTPRGPVYGSVPNSYIPDWGGLVLGTNINSTVQIFALPNGAVTGQVPPDYAGQALRELMENNAVDISACGSTT